MLSYFRKNSIGLNRNPSYPKMHSRKNSSTDQSNSSGTHEHLRSKDSLPSISFSAADGVKLELDAQSVAVSDKSDRSTDRKSFDGSESQKSGEPDPADLREKCFEKSLDTILDKCSETSMDLTLDSRDSKLTDESITSTKSTKSTERKKKSVPWYTVGLVFTFLIPGIIGSCKSILCSLYMSCITNTHTYTHKKKNW